MEVKVSKGKIVVTEAERNERFIREAERLEYLPPNYYGYKERYTPLREVGKTYDRSREADRDYGYLLGLISLAEHYGVTVTQEVKDELARIRREYDRAYARQKEAEREAQKRSDWKYLCNNGCGSCKMLMQNVDDFKCASCGEVLQTKNVPFYDYKTRMHYMFNFVPFPSEHCPLKAE